MIKDYYQLAKPGIVYGNLLAALAGFFLASHGRADLVLFLWMCLGLCLVIAAACVFNNIYDAEMDLKMARTKNRAIPSGRVPKRSAFVYGAALLLSGTAVLGFFTKPGALLAAFLGFAAYVFLYTPLKSRTVYATLIGSVAGAAPPLVGYEAVSGRFDLAAWLLFLLLVAWQMPHFYAIAIYRKADYQSAGVPVWPLARGFFAAKIQILVFIGIFMLTNAALVFYGFLAKSAGAALLFLGAWWFFKAFQGFKAAKEQLWARKLFLFSLIVLVVESLLLSISHFLP